MKIQTADINQAPIVARLIMTAMTDECCLYYAGPRHDLEDFRKTMTALVERTDSQYSYKNTLVATDDDGSVMGACVSYDGGELHRLREAFINAAREDFGMDFSNMDDETQAGELYLDSLAVFPEYRGRGVATALLKASVEKGKRMMLPSVGLLVDKGNPCAERLYRSVGFDYKNDATWGGHPMKHLAINV